MPAPLQHKPTPSRANQHHTNHGNGAAGEGQAAAPAHDMDTLKSAVIAARPGCGEVRSAIMNSSFQPRADRLHQPSTGVRSKSKLGKGVGGVRTMKATPGVSPNTITYSALIFSTGQRRAVGAGHGGLSGAAGAGGIQSRLQSQCPSPSARSYRPASAAEGKAILWLGKGLVCLCSRHSRSGRPTLRFAASDRGALCIPVVGKRNS